MKYFGFSVAHSNAQPNKQNAFTLAEVLITLAIIGVVAAISIPSVISNSQQQEFKTGLRKAVSVLNSAITMNMALDGESPYENGDLFNHLKKHMAIIKTTTMLPYYTSTSSAGYDSYGGDNYAFYTTDGMRFEFDWISGASSAGSLKLHESGNYACMSTNPRGKNYPAYCNGCGSYGLNSNRNNTTKVPCAILVDVNGDKKPTPYNVSCKDKSCGTKNVYVVPLPSDKKVKDIFTILITEDRAIPYGVTAQKAMYNSQK